MSMDFIKAALPDFIEENRLPAHTHHTYYKSQREADLEESSFLTSLNGLWKFHYASNPQSVIPGFEAVEYNCDSWADIRVPAHIQLEGYDAPQYANVQYPWDGHEDIVPGQMPQRFNPVASYVTYFARPAEPRVHISFQGVESTFSVWLNGHYVGYGSDAFTPSDFDLTPYLTDGENKLAVQCIKWSGQCWIEDQDFLRFSGIFRDVFLYAIPETHVDDLKVETPIADDYITAGLRVTLTALGTGRVSLALRKDGETLCSSSAALAGVTSVSFQDLTPLLWSAEAPHLYQLELEVYNAVGALCEVIRQPVGFRRFELKDSLMCLNGRRIEFHGVNRHDFDGSTGRAVTRQATERDIRTMKQNNINAIRTSHYPNSRHLYELCDLYGLYVIDEANLESHGYWDRVNMGLVPLSEMVPGDFPEWRATLQARANSLYQRDKNHPCVLIWSCGNESLGGKNILDMSNLFRSLDPSRLVHYEGESWDGRNPATSDIKSHMYTPAAEVEEMLKTCRERPMILCEYSHAMNNSCGALYKYTDLMEREPLFQGGFIWDYLDQSLPLRDRYGVEYQSYGGDWGDCPNDLEFSGNGIVFSDGSPSPKMQEVKYLYQNLKITVSADSFTVRNRNLFAGTEDYECVAELRRDGKLIAQKRVAAVVPAQETRTFPLPFALPAEPGEYAALISFRLTQDTLWAAKGHETDFGQGVFAVKAPAPAVILLQKPEFVTGAQNFGVRGRHFSMLFSKINGNVSYRFDGRQMLTAAPAPCFWRAPLSNDLGCRAPQHYAIWQTLSRLCRSDKPLLTENADSVSILFPYAVPLSQNAELSLQYTVFATGRVEVTLSMKPDETWPEPPELSVLLKMDADYDHLEWYGDGPAETYCDRKCGAKLGIHQSTVQESFVPYLRPMECGNHTGVRWAKVSDRRGRGLLFTGDEMDFSALPYTPYEMENAAHTNELPPILSTVVRPALMRMGVGGDNSWGATTHPEHCLPKGPLSFTFSFEGV